MYKLIEDLCKNEGISISRMCKDIGVSNSLLSDLKLGRSHTLSTKTLRAISVYFGVPLEHLLSESIPTEDDKQVVPPVAKRVVTDEDLIKAFWPDNELMGRDDLKMLRKAANWMAKVKSDKTSVNE